MNKLNIGIVGAGRIGNVHAQSITYHIPEAQIKRVSDVRVEAAKALAEKYAIPFYSDNYMDIINDPEIDAVLVCSPTPTHADIAIAAMQAGKHVFCEKPVDLTIEKIRKTAEVAEQTGLNEAVAAPGTAEKMAEVEAALLDGSLHVFDCSTWTVGGETITSYDQVAFYEGHECIWDGYFHESETRSAPYFDIIIDGITVK